MKSKIQKIQILKKGIVLILMLAMLMPTIAYAYTVNDGLLLQDSTALEKLMYGEIGSIVKKIEKHFKSNTTLYITNENQLRALAAYVDNGNSCYGKNIELLNDIEVNSDIDWEPIGHMYSNQESHFSGTFDGNGYTISNLTYKFRNSYDTHPESAADRSGIGFFAVVSDRGVVKNLNISNSNITTDGSKIGYYEVGNIVGKNYGLVLNCSANSMPGEAVVADYNNTIASIVGDNLGTVKYTDINILNNCVMPIIGMNGGKIDLPKEAEGSISKEDLYKKINEKYVKEEDQMIFSDSTSLSKIITVVRKGSENDKTDVEITMNPVTQSKFKIGDTLNLQFNIDKNLYAGLDEVNGKEIDLVGSASEEFKVYFPKVTMGEGVATPVSATRSKEGTILLYKYEVTEEGKVEFDNEDVIIDFTHNMEGENLYTCISGANKITYDTGDVITDSVVYSDLNLYVNSTIPSLDVKIYAKEALGTNRYAEGKEIIIELTSTERIKDTLAPEINIHFSQSGLGKYNYQSDKTIGNAVHVDALVDENGRTKWIYSYIIQPGDEGDLDIEYLSGYLEDLAGNTSDITTSEIENESTIYADTTTPRVEIIPDVENSSTNNDEITYEFKWSEEISEFDEQDITVINGTKGILIRPGDINEDGEITESDYDLLFEYIKPAPEQDEETEDKEEEETEEDTESPEEDEEEKEEEPVEYNVMYDVNADGILDDADIELMENYLDSNAKLTSTYAKMKITTDVEPGNVIDLKVIIEQDAYKDLVGHSNVRAENIVRVDKKAPILNSIEAYAELNVSEKECYTIGDEIKIVATFDESIKVPMLSSGPNTVGMAFNYPTLKVQFSETGDAKGQLEAQIEGNKLVYTYIVEEGDYGTLSISSFSGKVLDVAGNETRVTKRSLEGDTILVDTIAPTLKEINVVSPEEGIYKEGNTITFEAIYDEEVYVLKDIQVEPKELTDEEGNNEEENEEPEEVVVNPEIVFEEINSTNAPILKIKFGDNGVEREAIFSGYGEKEDGSLDRAKLVYTYDITPTKTITTETEVEGEIIEETETIYGDNGELIIISLKNREEKEEYKKYEVYKYYDVCDIAVNDADNTTSEKNTNGIIADTQRPEIKDVYAVVENPIISNTEEYYKAGNEVTITIDFYEEVKALEDKLPNIQIGFSEELDKEPEAYNDYSYEPEDWTILNDRIVFNYTIRDGDNGYIWVKASEGKFEDVAGNTNIDEEGFMAGKNVFADTTAPTLTYHTGVNSEQEVGKITRNLKYSEEIYSLSDASIGNITESNAPIYKYHIGEDGEIRTAKYVKTDGQVISYELTTINSDGEQDSGKIYTTFWGENICDRAGNLYYTQEEDTMAPNLERVEISSNAGENAPYCKEGAEIQVVASFDEEIYSQNMKLKVQFGVGETFELDGSISSEDKKQIIYTYLVKTGDTGEFKIIDICGITDDTIENGDKTYGYVADKMQYKRKIFSLESAKITVTGETPIADTTKPFVVSVIAKVNDVEISKYEKEEGKQEALELGRTNSNLVKYIVKFNESISELDASKIIITNGIIGEDDVKLIEGTNNTEYEIKVQTTLEGVQSLIFAQGAVKDRVGYLNLSERFNMVTTDFTKPIVRFISEYNGGVYVLPTNIGKVELRPNIQINEDILSIEYKWRKFDKTADEWVDINQYEKIENYSPSSDITIPEKSFTEGTYELCIKVVDLAGNVAETSKVYDILDSSIEIEFDSDYTNEDLTVTVKFEEGLTDNRKVTFKPEGTNQIVEKNAAGTDETGNSQYNIETNGTIYVEATDRIGNKVFTEEKIENIDKEAPVVTIGIKEANLVIGTEKDKATINAKVETTDNIGVITNQYLFLQENINLEELDNEKRKSLINELIGSTETYMKLVDSSKGETPYYIYIYVVDEAGNEVLEKAGPYHVYDTNERKIIVEKENDNVSNNVVSTNNSAIIPENIIGNIVPTPEVETEEKIVPPEIAVKGKLIDFKQEGKVVNITYNNFGENEENLNIIREAKITLTEATDGYIDPENNYVEVYKPTTITVEGKDACGNKVIATEEVTREEIEGPQIEVVGNPENWTNQNVKLEVYSNNELSALTVNGTNILSTDEQVVSNIDIAENGEYKFVATDIYGNVSEKVIKVTKIDKTKAEISKVESSNKTITITATDVVNEKEGSGIAEYAITDTTETPIKWSKSNEIKVTHDGIWYAWVMDKVGNITRSEEPVIVDTKAPTIRFDYTLLTVEPGIPIETNITTDEETIISYSWDNENWEASQELLTTVKVAKKYEATGKYTLYAKAVDKSGNESKAQIEFNVTRPEEVLDPQIVFEDLKTVQIDGIRYVKVSGNMELIDITNKMNKKALCGLTPEYTKLTEDDRVKTGSEIMLNGDTKYVIVVKGDVNSDGKIDFVKDIIRANNYRLGIIKLDLPQILAADIDSNGKIEFVKDLISINNYRLGLIKSL